jgi:lysine 2,3-aminomutase
MNTPADSADPSSEHCSPAPALRTGKTPLRSHRHPAWKDVPEAEWNDVGWQLKHSLRSAADVASHLELGDDERRATDSLGRIFRFSVTPYYFSLIDPRDADDPIRRMILPSLEEQTSAAETGELDPLGEKSDQVAPGLTHRYPDRVLFVVTSFCTSYCRFCIRKRNWHDSDAARSREAVDAALAYIRAHTEIRDVLISGGDPLTLPPHQLEYVLAGVRAIPHVEIVRIGSRELVQLPMRVTPELAALLERYSPLWVNTHFNHPAELTVEAAAAVERLLRAGIPVNNQSVLLRGVNDSVETMKSLMQGLVRIKVRPYYVYQCDDVTGAAHLRTSVRRGIEIMEGLRGHTTGFAVPTFVVDAPGGGGKIPLGPNYLVSMGERSVVVRNFEGVLVRVEDPPAEPIAARDASADDEPADPPQSVSDLVSGRGKRLVPGGLEHYDRRRGGTGRLRKRARPASGNGAPATSGRSGNGASAGGNGSGSGNGNGAHAPHLAAVPGRGKGSGARRKLS